MNKRFVLVLLSLGVLGTMIIGCNKGTETNVAQENVQEVKDENTDTEESTDAEETTELTFVDKKDIDLNKTLPDGKYRVAFKPENLTEKDGKYQLKAEMYYSDVYTKEEIEGLKEGATISIQGKDVKVNKIKKEDDGTVYINNRDEEIGEDSYYFNKKEDGTYEAGDGSTYDLVYKLGDVTIPIVSGNVHYIDEADGDNKEDVEKADKELGAFLKDDEYKGEIEPHGYIGEGTIVTIKDGCLVEIYRIYLQ